MIPLFSINQIRNADKFAVENYSFASVLLMENAAESIKTEIFKEYPDINKKHNISIICGKGNNGGDGFALARKLSVENFEVKVLVIPNENEISGDAKINFEILKSVSKDYKNLHIKFFKKISDLNFIKNSDFIVDAILGTGSQGELKSPIREIVENLNNTSAVKISIDNPTGLNLENASGNTIFRADLTVTLAELKTGLFYENGKFNSGKIVKGSIGIGGNYFDKLDVKEYLIEPEDAILGLPKKVSNLNKYSAGKVFVIAGSGKMSGAAVFAINAAMISGSGAGYLAFPKSVRNLVQPKMNSAIVFSYNDNYSEILSTKNLDELSEKINWADSVLIGPGLGRNIETQNSVVEIIKKNPKTKFVIDADAIFSLGNGNYKKLNLANCVFTPHHKEFADLLGIELEELKLNLFKFGRKFVEETKSFLVLKGASTILFNKNGEIFINTSGNSGLAKFGSGDVLSGIISSFIAQKKELEKSIISSVYLHGLTADLISAKESEFGITPEKIISNFPKTIKFLRKSFV
ncbi:MAG: NAD(P)H-hydrate dehydratase [Ignavibacteriae bacterium]|nr:NAD(P)H-hydrate dehydratase [Ignavibacteriota bacterium]